MPYIGTMMTTNGRLDNPILRWYLNDLGASAPLEASEELELALRMRKAREKLVQLVNRLPDSCRDQILGDLEVIDLTADFPFETMEPLVTRLLDQAAVERDPAVIRLARRACAHWSDLGQIRSTFISRNLRLVVHIAKRFAKSGVPLADLIQEGNLGLIRALDRFSPERGAKFGTYAAMWIMQAIYRETALLNRVVRIPDYQLRRRQAMARSIDDLSTRLGRMPNIEEIALKMGVTEDKVTDTLCHSAAQVDLDEPQDGRDGLSLMEVLPDDDAKAPLAALETSELCELLGRSLDHLNLRQREVLRLRYGLGDDRPRTLQEIGLRLKVSRERVRQIEVEAMKILRVRLTRTRRATASRGAVRCSPPELKAACSGGAS